MGLIGLQSQKRSVQPPLPEMGIEPSRFIGSVVGPSWVHPSIVVQDTGRIGLGLSAMEHIPKGARVVVFGGTILNWRQFAELPLVLRDIPFQIDDDLLFGVTSIEDIGIGERINHSCDPNTGFVSEMKLVALRDINPGEAVTMDYATCISIDDYQLVCKCGSKNCRGVIRGSDWKDPVFNDRMFNYLQPYLRKKITERRERGGISRRIRKYLTQLIGL